MNGNYERMTDVYCEEREEKDLWYECSKETREKKLERENEREDLRAWLFLRLQRRVRFSTLSPHNVNIFTATWKRVTQVRHTCQKCHSNLDIACEMQDGVSTWNEKMLSNAQERHRTDFFPNQNLLQIYPPTGRRGGGGYTAFCN